MVDWNSFTAQSEEELETLRAITMMIEGEDPFAPIQPIEGIAPPKCPDCGETLSFNTGNCKTKH